MNLIEQLGGYEKSKRELKLKEDNSMFQCCAAVTADMIRYALLEYRRDHGIFEVLDKVVYMDDFMHDGILIVSNVDDRVWLNDDAAVCIKDMVRHAKDEEIAAGHRI